MQTCGSNGQWGSASNCPSVPGANSYCAAGTCTFDCQTDYDDCDNNAANGCEVNLNSDANNCGQCGHSCCGGTCGSGACQIHDTGIYANNFAYSVDSDDIYSGFGTTVSKTPRLGGATTTVATTTTTVVGITTTSQNIFWSTSGSSIPLVHPVIQSKPLADGLTTTYGSPGSSNSASGDYLVTTDDDVFFRSTSYNTISYWHYGANTPVPIYSGSYTYEAPFVTDGQYVYATYASYGASNQKPIVRVPIHGGTVETFADFAPTSPTAAYSHVGLSTDGVNLYYLLYSGTEPSKAGVWKRPFAGGAATQLVTMGNGFSAITATDGQYVYYADANAQQIRKVSVNGGASTPIYSGPDYFWLKQSPKVVSECLYWVDGTIQTIAVSP